MQGTWALTLRMLRQDSRLLRFHLLRLLVALLLLMGVYYMLESSRYSESPGLELLEVIAGANFWAVTLGGVLLFAPMITEEKEDQTLSLLRMTNLGPASLLLGKTIPKLFQLALVLVIQLPLVCLTRTLGGVSWWHLWTVYELIFSQMMAVVGLSLLASVVMRTSGGAITLAAALTLFWMMGCSILSEILQWCFGTNHLTWGLDQLGSMSPGYQLFDGRINQPTAFSSLVLSASVGGISWAIAVFTFDYWTQHEASQTELEWMTDRCRAFWYRVTQRFTRSQKSAPANELSTSSITAADAPSAQTIPLRSEAKPGMRRTSCHSWSNAIAWKEFHLMGGGRTGWLIRWGLILGGLVATFTLSGVINAILIGRLENVDFNQVVSRVTEAVTVFSLYALCIDLVYLTVNLFRYELKCQTWESLLILPLSVGAISRQKIWGAACHLVPWIVAISVSLLWGMGTSGWGDFLYQVTNDSLTSLGIFLQIVTQLFTLLAILTWLSLRMNPWIAILLTGALYWGIGIVYLISAFAVFGFLSPPGPYWQQVMFNVIWIGGISILGWIVVRLIRSRLQGEAARI